MCASYISRYSYNELRIDFTLSDLQRPLNLQDAGPVRPTVAAPFVYAEGGEILLGVGRFGIWKPWMTGSRISTFNARCETVSDKTLYAPLVRSRRALIPATAWHEWTGPKGGKTKWRFTVDGGAPFAFAGLWDTAVATDDNPKGAAAGEAVRSFTILTCAPNELAGQYHHRMPVVVDRADYARWLDGAADPAPLCRPLAADRMQVTRE